MNDDREPKWTIGVIETGDIVAVLYDGSYRLADAVADLMGDANDGTHFVMEPADDEYIDSLPTPEDLAGGA